MMGGSSNACGGGGGFLGGGESSTNSFDYRSLLPGGNTNNNNYDYDSESNNNNNNNSSTSSSISSFIMDPLNSNDRSSSFDNDDVICLSCLPEMTWSERLMGCCTCMIAGYLLSIGSIFRLLRVIFHGDPIPLVVNATIGNIIALLGSCFLTGPHNQIQRMFQKTRYIATIMYLLSFIITIFVLLLPKYPTRGIMLLLLLLSQYISITWYCLSYIPFARDVISNFVTRQLLFRNNSNNNTGI